MSRREGSLHRQLGAAGPVVLPGRQARCFGVDVWGLIELVNDVPVGAQGEARVVAELLYDVDDRTAVVKQ
jgi:hypothetical protein